MDGRTDKERLDWLGTGANKDMYPSFNLTHYSIRVHSKSDGRHYKRYDGLTLRGAIDCAMSAEEARRTGRMR